MRKLNLLIIGIILAMMLTNCTKEDVVTNDVTKQASVVERLQVFNTKLASADKNAGEEMSIQDAEWYIEGALNYNYSKPDKAYDYISSDTIKISFMPNAQGMVDFMQVSEVYEKALSALSNHYYNKIGVDTAHKQLIATNMQQIELSSNYYFISKIGIISTDKTSWIEVADQIEAQINASLAPEPGTFFTGVETVENIEPWNYPNPNDDVPGDNMYDYLMFYNYTGWPNFDTELTDEEMAFYYEGTLQVIDMVRPAWKTAISIELVGDAIVQNDDNYPIFHFGEWFEYGMKVVFPRPIQPIPID